MIAPTQAPQSALTQTPMTLICGEARFASALPAPGAAGGAMMANDVMAHARRRGSVDIKVGDRMAIT